MRAGLRRGVAALAVLAGAAGCRAPHELPAEAKVPAEGHLVYAAHVSPGLGLAPSRRIGRGVAPGRLTPLPIYADEAQAPLRAPLLWQLPSEGVALAAVAGSDDDGAAVELIDIDAGRVRWRVREPAGPIVGVTAAVIVGAGAGTWALDLEGEPLWQTESAFAAMAGETVAVANSMEQVTLLAVASGRELWRAELPDGLVASDVRWACPAERELLMIDEGGGLHRLLQGEAATRRAWTAAERFAHAEGCGGDIVAATPADSLGVYQLALVERGRGAVKARVAGVRGHWRRNDGGWAVARAEGVRLHDARLAPGRLLTAAALGPRLASRGERALVEAQQGLVLLEADGAVSPLAVSAESAALGDRAVLTSAWSRSPAHVVMRGGLPATAAPGEPRALSRSSKPALPPAPLIDAGELGAVQATSPPRFELAAPAEAGLAVAAGQGTESSLVAVLRGEAQALVRYGLDGQLRWRTANGCRGERPTALAADDSLVLCLGGGAGAPSTLVASELASGAVVWQRELAAEHLQLHGELVLARTADRATLLRARDGAELAHWSSDDGGPIRAALISAGGATLLVGHEASAVVARWPLAGMLPLWAVAVDGAVVDLQPDGDRALVVLAGAEAYSLRGLDGASTPIAGEAERWLASGDGLLGWSQTAGQVRVALHARDGALRWAYDLSLPGTIELMVSPARGGSSILYGENRELALPIGERGPGVPISLPESAATAIWVRPLTSGPSPRWAGVSTTAARWWAF